MKQRKRMAAFFAEALLLLLLLLIGLSVVVRMFGVARTMSREAEQKTSAALIVQSVSAEFLAGAGTFALLPRVGEADTVTAQYDDAGLADASGEFAVQTALSTEGTAAGRLVTAKITVSASGETLAQVTVEKYLEKQ